MEALTPLLILAFGALVVVAVVLLIVDIDITQTRRIEKQVARDVRRIRMKTIKGWSAESIMEHYPHLTHEQVTAVQRAMRRRAEAAEEVDLLKSIWSMETPEPD